MGLEAETCLTSYLCVKGSFNSTFYNTGAPKPYAQLSKEKDFGHNLKAAFYFGVCVGNNLQERKSSSSCLICLFVFHRWSRCSTRMPASS